MSDIQVKGSTLRGPINTYAGMNGEFGHTSPGLSELQKSVFMIPLCKIIWGAVSIRTVPGNKGTRDFAEEGTTGLEGSGDECPVAKGRGKTKQKQSKTK